MKNSIRIISLMLSILYANLACAETLLGAMTKAYNNNVSLNVSRYAARVSDEDVAVAMSAVRPVVNVTGSYSSQWLNKDSSTYSDTGALQIQINQRIFDGFQTANNIKAARAQAAAQRQALRNEEQNQLNNTVAAYANVFASREIVKLRHQNLLALEEQVRSANARLIVGEGTKTDYAQAKAAYSRALSEYSEALAETTQAEAVYRQVVGVEPDSLERPTACNALPRSLDDAYAIAITDHPAILSAQAALDASKFVVASKEGALLPEVGFGFSRNYNEIYSNHGLGAITGSGGPSTSVGLQLSLPLYHGGANFAFIRKAKEQAAQAHLQSDLYRNNVRAALLSSWAKLKSSRTSVNAYLSSVKAANIALNGRISENKVGQATLLDVLNTRSQLITMQVALVNARRNLVIASYNVKAAIGHMTAPFLKLNVHLYDPLLHYHQTEYRFIGSNVSPLD